MTAAGDGFTQDRRRTFPWAAGLAGGDARIDLSRIVALGIGFDLYAPFVRTDFEVENDEGVVLDDVSTDGVGFGPSLDLVFRFGAPTTAPGPERR